MINEKALYETLKGVKERVQLTSQGRVEMDKYLEVGKFEVFSEPVLHELSLVYPNIIEPLYRDLSGGDYLPNIFVKMED